MRALALILTLLLGAGTEAAEKFGLALTPATVGFTPSSGCYTSTVSVKLHSSAPSATIRYTLDGTEPTVASKTYKSELKFSRSTRVRARAFAADGTAGKIAGASYTLLGEDLASFTSNLPLLVLNTYGKQILKGERVTGDLAVHPAAGGRARLNSPAEFSGRIGVEFRGSSSFNFPKKSFRVETVDETIGNDSKVSLLGLPADSDWVLYGPYNDKTLMRDVLAYDLWEEMGHYSVRRRFVELFCDQDGGILSSNDYVGVYVLLEKIKRGPHRVNVAKLSREQTAEPEISGGYLLKRDRYDRNDNPFTTPMGFRLGIEYPKGTNLAPAQKQWLQGWLNEFESVLMSDTFADPSNGYAKYIDVPTAIDHFWIVEMPNTLDGYVLSTYMHKDRNGKLTLSPIWDRNLSFGNGDYKGGDKTGGWWWERAGAKDLWYRRLFEDPEFNQKHIDRWGELRTSVFATSNILSRVDAYAVLLAEAQAREFVRWPRLGVKVWRNAPADWPNKTYADTVKYLKDFIRKRLDWIDTQFVPAPAFNEAGGVLSLSSLPDEASRRIYFTLDGADPRGAGGKPSPSAREYKAPIKLGDRVRVTARACHTGQWSPMVTGVFMLR